MTINELKETLSGGGVQLSLEKVGGDDVAHADRGCWVQCNEEYV